MKKKLVFLAAFILAISGLSSCEALLGNCKICSLNTYENGLQINSQSEAEYCDDDLIWVLAQPDIVAGSTVTKWECQ